VNGARLDPSTTLGDAPLNAHDPVALAASNTEIAAAWFLEGDILFTRIALDGSRLIEPKTIVQLGSVISDESPPALSWTGSEYVAAWVGRQSGYRDSVIAQRLAANGTPIGTAKVIASYPGGQSLPQVGKDVSIGYNGVELAMAWVDPDGAGRVVHLAPDLTPLAAPVQVTDSFAKSQLTTSRPRLLWTGEEWLLNYLTTSLPGANGSGSNVVSVCE
jgi:hypothetical protein